MPNIYSKIGNFQRNFTAPQLEGLLKDMSILNLSKYISEVASALVDAKLKLNDVPAAVLLCSEMHNTYSEFSKVLLEHWMKVLSIKKDEKVSKFGTHHLIIYLPVL